MKAGAGNAGPGLGPEGRLPGGASENQPGGEGTLDRGTRKGKAWREKEAGQSGSGCRCYCSQPGWVMEGTVRLERWAGVSEDVRKEEHLDQRWV